MRRREAHHPPRFVLADVRPRVIVNEAPDGRGTTQQLALGRVGRPTRHGQHACVRPGWARCRSAIDQTASLVEGGLRCQGHGEHQAVPSVAATDVRPLALLLQDRHHLPFIVPLPERRSPPGPARSATPWPAVFATRRCLPPSGTTVEATGVGAGGAGRGVASVGVDGAWRPVAACWAARLARWCWCSSAVAARPLPGPAGQRSAPESGPLGTRQRWPGYRSQVQIRGLTKGLVTQSSHTLTPARAATSRPRLRPTTNATTRNLRMGNC